MKRPLLWLALALLLLVVGASVAGRSSSPAPPAEPADVAVVRGPPADAVTIAKPASGLVTSARSVQVRGSAPWISPDDGEAVVRVTVNRRPHEVFPTAQGYATVVALELGRNEIVVRGSASRFDDDEAVRGSARVVIERRRAPGDDTGVLDRATASMLADSTEEAYWLCGEDDGCSTEPVCFKLGARRVDCAIARWYTEDPVRRCGHVYTLRLRGERLYAGSYACRGRVSPDPRRLVRASVTPILSRVVIDADDEDTWSRFVVNEPNAYGAPRFNMARDRFMP
ncbi:hypothetical protein DVA67_007765 [Solirubrobacter sp. CPCC 204708]|uniref:Bacterial Ig domain-containing protein n=1 Tax=Solirubrobacter deserti TaxID=2282478 RepID=A0ABT4RJQ6_9ACTN|nr:hypothetical protein [Solirubrobacter deserti]MBE2315868.1 hypothetical protein [Solirubrobacter deserti]MDA0138794.1 hypothetical protein [Solirubrobacter deserti]